MGIPSNSKILAFYEETVNGNGKKRMNLRGILKNGRIRYQISIQRMIFVRT